MKTQLSVGVLAITLLAAVGCDKSAPGAPTTGSTGLEVRVLVPNSGPTESSVTVSVNGGGFAPGARVTFDGVPVETSFVSSFQLSAKAPPHDAGAVDVVVTNPNGQSARLAAAYTYVPVAITSIEPSIALVGDVVSIVGTGFLAGATVTLGGVRAWTVGTSGTLIRAIAPAHEPGAVEVVVSNPGGQGARREGLFAYGSVTLTASAGVVAAGSALSVSWVAPPGRSRLDWVGLFLESAPSESYDHGWWSYTNGVASATLALTAPTQPGHYEFRYFVDDGLTAAARSARVTVTASGSSLVSPSSAGPPARGR